MTRRTFVFNGFSNTPSFDSTQVSRWKNYSDRPLLTNALSLQFNERFKFELHHPGIERRSQR